MTRRTALRTLRLIYLVALGLVFAWLVVDNASTIGDVLRSARVGWLVLALGASFGMLAIGALFWERALAAFGVPVSVGTVLRAAARSLPARYAPGGVWFAVSRVALLRQAGLPTGALALTAVFETILTAGIALGLGALVLGALGALPGGTAWVLIGIVSLGAVVAPPLTAAVARRIARARDVRPIPLDNVRSIELVAVMAAFWIWSASTFWIYTRAFPVVDELGLFLVAGGFVFSWAVGFVTILAPQGLGVFEVTLAAILVDGAVAEIAVVIGGYRVLVLVRDVVAVALAESLSTRARRPTGEQEVG